MKKNNDSSADKPVTYSYRLESRDYNHITKHIRALKRQNKIKSEQEWLLDAFKDKLKKDVISELDDDEHRDRNLYFKLSYKINQEIEKKIELIKRDKISYSKKRWFFEAIYEKMNLDENEQDCSKISSDTSLLKKLSKKSVIKNSKCN